MRNPGATGKIRDMIGLQGCERQGGLMLLACMLIVFYGCGGAHVREVAVIEKTRTYHRDDCAPVHMARVEEMTVAEAKAKNFRPCPICKPDSE